MLPDPRLRITVLHESKHGSNWASKHRLDNCFCVCFVFCVSQNSAAVWSFSSTAVVRLHMITFCHCCLSAALWTWSLRLFERHRCFHVASSWCEWHLTELISSELFVCGSERLPALSAVSPFQTFRCCCWRKHTCRFTFHQVFLTQHNEQSSQSRDWNVTCICASGAFEPWTVFNQLTRFKRYCKRSSGLLASDAVCGTQTETEAGSDFTAKVTSF